MAILEEIGDPTTEKAVLDYYRTSEEMAFTFQHPEMVNGTLTKVLKASGLNEKSICQLRSINRRRSFRGSLHTYDVLVYNPDTLVPLCLVFDRTIMPHETKKNDGGINLSAVKLLPRIVDIEPYQEYIHGKEGQETFHYPTSILPRGWWGFYAFEDMWKNPIAPEAEVWEYAAKNERIPDRDESLIASFYHKLKDGRIAWTYFPITEEAATQLSASLNSK